MAVSVFIQTLNEEQNLPRCLDSLCWSDDIVVLDSLSADSTPDIVKSYGGRFYQRPYGGRANNQNWAVENIEFKHPWVYYSDADEVVPAALRDEILAVTSDPHREEVAYRVRFKNMLCGRWIRRSSLYPSWIPRLWRPEKIRWKRQANPVAVIDGPVGYLQNHFEHYSFNKGFCAWFEKHNKYSTLEALETLKELDDGAIDWPGLVATDPARRRMALKHLSFRMPGRPYAKFLYMYLLRMGFLDGRAGLTYCSLQAIYEYMICCKVKELRRREQNLPI